MIVGDRVSHGAIGFDLSTVHYCKADGPNESLRDTHREVPAREVWTVGIHQRSQSQWLDWLARHEIVDHAGRALVADAGQVIDGCDSDKAELRHACQASVICGRDGNRALRRRRRVRNAAVGNGANKRLYGRRCGI